MDKLTVDQLVELIQDYKEGRKKQERPMIIWFDKTEGDILKYARHGDYYGMADALSKNDKEIVLNYETGSPFTDHDNVIDEEKGVVRKITDAERYSFVIPSSIFIEEEGKTRLPKVYLHSSFTRDMGKKGLTTLEFSKMIHDRLNLPVLLFFPLIWKEKIKDSLEGYEELVCTAPLEDQKKRWFERMTEKSEDGIQKLDNFYIDFLKTAPEDLLSTDFDTSGEIVMGIVPRYEKWQTLGRRMHRAVMEVIDLLDKTDDEKTAILSQVYSDGNLDFDKFEEVLKNIPDDKWAKFIEDEIDIYKDYEYVEDEGDRNKLFKLHISTDYGKFPYKATEKLLEFYNIPPQS